MGQGIAARIRLLEIVTVLLSRRDHSVAVRVGRILLDADDMEFVPCSDLFLKTMQTFTNQPGTRLSFAGAAIADLARSPGGRLDLELQRGIPEDSWPSRQSQLD